MCLCDPSSCSRSHLPQLGQFQRVTLEERAGEPNHTQAAWEDQRDTTHGCWAVRGTGAAPQGLPGSRTLYLHHDGQTPASVPGAKLGALLCHPLSSPPGPERSLPSTRISCSFRQHCEYCSPPHRRRDQPCPEQTRDTVLYAWLRSPHLKWLPDASCNLPKPHSPADYPMSYCFCHFSELPLFCLWPSLPAFMLFLCSVLEPMGLQLHLASPLLLPVLIEMSLLRGKSI